MPESTGTSGVTIFVCSVFFVFLALLKQNVLIFVSQNLGRHSSSTLPLPTQTLFRAYDLDYNGVIDTEEFTLIARRLLPKSLPGLEVSDPELDVVYVDVKVVCGNCEMLGDLNATNTYPVTIFSHFKPPVCTLGYTWVLYKPTITTLPSTHFVLHPRPNQLNFSLHNLLSLLHWNVVLNTRTGNVSGAIVSALSDSHVRINFLLRVEYQLSLPPESPLWWVPCGSCQQTSCPLIGQAVFSTDLQALSSVSINCGEENESTLQMKTVKGPYNYKIINNKLVAVDETESVSYDWYSVLQDWRPLLEKFLFSEE